ncbi:MAG: SMI1/KNR4 family protein [Polyangiaceae bacterium]|nr:SMI1/KNR4 family protein [Polyangiaceae bacterium]
MTMLEIVESGRKLSVDDLARVEQSIGRPLPEQYGAFLLAHNGGRPRPNLIDIHGADFKGTDISVFHGIDDSTESCDLLWNLEVLEGCKDNKLLPIACDSGGNIFMLDLSKEHHGEVLYFDSAEVPPRPYFLAKDFNGFLAQIRDWTPEELADIQASLEATAD